MHAAADAMHDPLRSCLLKSREGHICCLACTLPGRAGATASHDGKTNDMPAPGGASSSQAAFTATAAAAGAGVQEQTQYLKPSTGSPGPARLQQQLLLQHRKQQHRQQQPLLQHSQQQHRQRQLLLQHDQQQHRQQQLLQSSNSSLQLATAAHAGETNCRSSSMHHTPAVQLVSYHACCCRCDAWPPVLLSAASQRHTHLFILHALLQDGLVPLPAMDNLSRQWVHTTSLRFMLPTTT
jgi:hypothetical protein